MEVLEQSVKLLSEQSCVRMSSPSASGLDHEPLTVLTRHVGESLVTDMMCCYISPGYNSNVLMNVFSQLTTE